MSDFYGSDTFRYVSNLLLVAGGGDPVLAERFNEDPDVGEDTVLEWLEEEGLPPTRILREDVERACSGEEPLYFLDHDRFAEIYRKRFGISQPHLDRFEGWLPNLSETEKKSAFPLPWKYAACYVERKHFYESEEWQRCAKLIRVLDQLQCRDCGCSGSSTGRLHVHHDEVLYTVFSGRFSYNFDTCRLRTLCGGCHRKLHSRSIRKYTCFVGTRSKSEKRADAALQAHEKQCHNNFPVCFYCHVACVE